MAITSRIVAIAVYSITNYLMAWHLLIPRGGGDEDDLSACALGPGLALLFLIIASLGCLSKLAFVDPGVMPRDLACLDMAEEGRMFCSLCALPKPQRCHHCRLCNRCILRMDHHCRWLRRCIGHANYKAYFLFLFYNTLSAALVLILLWRRLTAKKGIALPQWSYPLIAVDGLSLLVAFGCVGYLFVWHLYLVSQNLTTIEYYQIQRMKRDPTYSCAQGSDNYSIGLLQNFQAVLGSNVFYWLTPTLPDRQGVSFPMRSSPRWSSNSRLSIAASAAALNGGGDGSSSDVDGDTVGGGKGGKGGKSGGFSSFSADWSDDCHMKGGGGGGGSGIHLKLGGRKSVGYIEMTSPRQLQLPRHFGIGSNGNNKAVNSSSNSIVTCTSANVIGVAKTHHHASGLKMEMIPPSSSTKTRNGSGSFSGGVLPLPHGVSAGSPNRASGDKGGGVSHPVAPPVPAHIMPSPIVAAAVVSVCGRVVVRGGGGGDDDDDGGGDGDGAGGNDSKSGTDTVVSITASRSNILNGNAKGYSKIKGSDDDGGSGKDKEGGGRGVVRRQGTRVAGFEGMNYGREVEEERGGEGNGGRRRSEASLLSSSSSSASLLEEEDEMVSAMAVDIRTALQGRSCRRDVVI